MSLARLFGGAFRNHPGREGRFRSIRLLPGYLYLIKLFVKIFVREYIFNLPMIMEM